jgi:CheY-like chemotaxis protein
MNIIFWPGFTTGDSITSISGRGIGLDVVKTKISQLNGKVKVISEFGKGSIVRIEIPVTLTTLRVFLVDIGGQTFAIPIQLINTFIVKKQSEIKTNNGVRSIVYNDNIIPLYYLSDILEISSETKRHEKETILIVEADEKTIGLVVDKLIGDQDILQKKLPPPLYKVKNISGVTNMSSGELCLILNMQDIMHYDFNKAMAMNAGQNLLTKDILAYKRILVVDDSITTRTMIKNILLNASYTADIVSSVEEAFSMLKAGHYDLIITDLHMPKIDGFEFVSMLKGDEMYSDIPVIVMSSLPEKEAAKTLAQYNIDYYICKENFNQEEFSNQIETILTKYHDY